MTVVIWPPELLRQVRATYFLKYRTRSAGVNLNGQSQIVGPGTSSWSVRLELPTLFDGHLMKLFDAYVSQMQGRANIAELSICDPFRHGPLVSPAQEPFSDGTWFEDGTGFITDGTQPMVTTDESPIGDTSLYVSLTSPVHPRLRPGDEFSYDNFLYRVVASKTSTGWVKFLPRLRSVIPADAVLQTDPAKIHVRFASDDEGRRARQYLRFGEPIALNFVEAFDR